MSSSSKTYFFRGYVAIDTDLGLDEAAKSISEYMLGGVAFDGREKRIRDELDAVYLEIFGIRFILVEQLEEMILEFHSSGKLGDAVELDLSAHVLTMLKDWPGGAVSLFD